MAAQNLLKNKKVKQVAFIAAVSLGTVFVVNTLAKRFAPVAKARQLVDQGL